MSPSHLPLSALDIDAYATASAAVIFTLRLYAIFMRDRKVLYASAVLTVPRVAINIFQIVTDSFHATKGTIEHRFGQCATPSAKHLDGHVISMGCASDAAFSDAQYAENKFLGHIGAPLGGMDGDMSPHAHEAWPELCEDGHDTEEGHTGSVPTWPGDMGSYGEAPETDSGIAVSEFHIPSRVSSASLTGRTVSRFHESIA
ncbi:uncharacterized protein STEHIDRAFT_156860 [Stereum hirsutum FP-91666 SS1]|uniref:uncharacterized protein n=1 Tax=Stereum hirsutum (strain FP-91666) TaxID=721885 RepID=UPI000440EB6E|nr:uncharacterized protein STEHIDRAFT_156860 [Stereum hirsutum FP-91666 SS1]EIM86553.1 hypothetical protein STEHIDRAFT_156860 [Stereum hirsutum FP-91666 SS1]